MVQNALGAHNTRSTISTRMLGQSDGSVPPPCVDRPPASVEVVQERAGAHKTLHKLPAGAGRSKSRVSSTAGPGKIRSPPPGGRAGGGAGARRPSERAVGGGGSVHEPAVAGSVGVRRVQVPGQQDGAEGVVGYIPKAGTDLQGAFPRL